MGYNEPPRRDHERERQARLTRNEILDRQRKSYPLPVRQSLAVYDNDDATDYEIPRQWRLEQDPYGIKNNKAKHGTVESKRADFYYDKLHSQPTRGRATRASGPRNQRRAPPSGGGVDYYNDTDDDVTPTRAGLMRSNSISSSRRSLSVMDDVRSSRGGERRLRNQRSYDVTGSYDYTDGVRSGMSYQQQERSVSRNIGYYDSKGMYYPDVGRYGPPSRPPSGSRRSSIQFEKDLAAKRFRAADSGSRLGQIYEKENRSGSRCGSRISKMESRSGSRMRSSSRSGYRVESASRSGSRSGYRVDTGSRSGSRMRSDSRSGYRMETGSRCGSRSGSRMRSESQSGNRRESGSRCGSRMRSGSQYGGSHLPSYDVGLQASGYYDQNDDENDGDDGDDEDDDRFNPSMFRSSYANNVDFEDESDDDDDDDGCQIPVDYSKNRNRFKRPEDFDEDEMSYLGRKQSNSRAYESQGNGYGSQHDGYGSNSRFERRSRMEEDERRRSESVCVRPFEDRFEKSSRQQRFEEIERELQAEMAESRRSRMSESRLRFYDDTKRRSQSSLATQTAPDLDADPQMKLSYVYKTRGPDRL